MICGCIFIGVNVIVDNVVVVVVVFVRFGNRYGIGVAWEKNFFVFILWS